MSNETGESETESDGDSPTLRILRAIEVIAGRGLTSADDLRHELGVSKTSAWRIVNTLRQAGWVRMRYGMRFMEFSDHLDDLFSSAHFSDPEFTGLADRLVDYASEKNVHIDLFHLNSQDEVVLYETTRRILGARPSDELIDEQVMSAVLVAMPDSRAQKYLAAFPEFAAVSASGNDVRGQYFWRREYSSVCIPFVGRMGSPAALRLSGRKTTTRTYEELHSTCLDLQLRMADMVKGFETDQSF